MMATMSSDDDTPLPGPDVPAKPTPKPKPRDPLHGLTLEAILTELQAYFGWADLAEQVPIRCFSFDPSIKSSLAFLRKTPWAREKVESLYLFMQREKARTAAAEKRSG
jgi:uncharacterized protein (DUF2132 family)